MSWNCEIRTSGRGGFLIPTAKGGFINRKKRQSRPIPQEAMVPAQILFKRVRKYAASFHEWFWGALGWLPHHSHNRAAQKGGFLIATGLLTRRAPAFKNVFMKLLIFISKSFLQCFVIGQLKVPWFCNKILARDPQGGFSCDGFINPKLRLYETHA